MKHAMGKTRGGRDKYLDAGTYWYRFECGSKYEGQRECNYGQGTGTFMFADGVSWKLEGPMARR